jgi:hypothetical protein
MTDTKKQLPEVAAYIQALDDAEKAREASMDAAEKKYPKRHDWRGEESAKQRSGFGAEIDAAYEAQRKANSEAWDALKESSDPLVKWIAENCGEYRGEARRVLSALPATIDELDELASENEWCGVWGQFRDNAAEAGVITGITPLSEARKTVLDGIDGLTCCRLGRDERRKVNKLLDAFLAAETASEAPAPEPADSLAVSA